jgi:esterase/lipase
MNVFFNSKILNLEKNYKLLKDKNKLLETNLNIFMNTKNYNYDKQETEIKYLKYKSNNYGELLNEYQEEIKKLNKKLNYLTITIISLFAFIFINYH